VSARKRDHPGVPSSRKRDDGRHAIRLDFPKGLKTPEVASDSTTSFVFDSIEELPPSTSSTPTCQGRALCRGFCDDCTPRVGGRGFGEHAGALLRPTAGARKGEHRTKVVAAANCRVGAGCSVERLFCSVHLAHLPVLPVGALAKVDRRYVHVVFHHGERIARDACHLFHPHLLLQLGAAPVGTWLRLPPISSTTTRNARWTLSAG